MIKTTKQIKNKLCICIVIYLLWYFWLSKQLWLKISYRQNFDQYFFICCLTKTKSYILNYFTTGFQRPLVKLVVWA